MPVGLCGVLRRSIRVRGPIGRGQLVGVEGPVGRVEADQPGDGAGHRGAGGVGVVGRLEHHDLVAGLAQREQGGGDGLGGPDGDEDLGLGSEVEAVPDVLVGGDGRRSSGMPSLGGYWLRPGGWPRPRSRASSARTVGVGEALAEVDGSGGQRQLGHGGEDRRREGAEPFDELVLPLVRHPHDGTGALWSGRIVLTVANFNMHAGVDGWGRPFDTIAVCRELDADVIVLEESWTSGEAGAPDEIGQAEQIAAALGYEAFTCTLAEGRRVRPDPAATDKWMSPQGLRAGKNALFFDSERPYSAQVGGSARFTEAEPGSWGIAVLVRRGITVDDSRVLHLPQLGRDRVRRAAIVVDLTVEDHQLSVIGTHMSHLQFGSHRHYADLQEAPAHGGGPARCGPAGRHEPVGATGAGVPARVAPSRQGTDLAGRESAQPDRPHSGPGRHRDRAGRGAAQRRL